jgi:hypothetical protein
MNPLAYDEMNEVERDHWWYVGRRAILSKIISDMKLEKDCKKLEIGCGTGGNLEMLSSYGNLTAVDMSSEAVKMAKIKNIKDTDIFLGSLPNEMPDFAYKFDLICMFDVLEHIENPCSVARMIMEKTPHVMLVGEGALEFALSNGFKKTNLLTEESKQRWLEWKKTSKYETPINRENHDTIGMLAIDHNGNVCGVCTTSGMGYKMHGRVGDSPILGAGLFVDNEIGGAVATGVGELVMRTCGSFLVVENMRNGMSPEKACKAAVERIISKNVELKNTQVGFIALRKDGTYGGYSLHDGFEYAVTYNGYHKLLKTNYKIK